MLEAEFDRMGHHRCPSMPEAVTVSRQHNGMGALDIDKEGHEWLLQCSVDILRCPWCGDAVARPEMAREGAQTRR